MGKRNKAGDRRRRLLAKVHLLKKEIGLEDDTYREAIEALFGVRSAAGLTDDQLVRLISHLDPAGAASAGGYPGRPRNMDHPERGAMLRKVEALLADAGRPWAYANSIARKMWGVQRVEWLSGRKLHAVIAALEYDRRRRTA